MHIFAIRMKFFGFSPQRYLISKIIILRYLRYYLKYTLKIHLKGKRNRLHCDHLHLGAACPGDADADDGGGGDDDEERKIDDQY